MIGLYDSFRTHGAIQIGDIAKIEDEVKEKGKAATRKIVMRDGKSFDVFDFQAFEILWRPIQIIPAPPGTNIVWAYTGEEYGGPEIVRRPVVAWGLCVDGMVRPVTLIGVSDSADETIYVEHPGGRIEAVGEYGDPEGFPDAAAMLSHFLDVAKAEASADA